MDARAVESEDADRVDITIRRRRRWIRRVVVTAVVFLVLANVCAAVGSDAWSFKDAWPFVTFEAGLTAWVLWRVFGPHRDRGSRPGSLGGSSGNRGRFDLGMYSAFGASLGTGTDAGFACGGLDGGFGSGTSCGGGS